MLASIVLFSLAALALSIVCVIFIVGLACAILMIPSSLTQLLSLPRRRALMKIFLSSVRDGQTRAKFQSQKAIFGKGFTHTFVGTTGTICFRLVRSHRSFREEDLYCLEIANGMGRDNHGFDFHLFSLDTKSEKPHPVVECYFILMEGTFTLRLEAEAS